MPIRVNISTEEDAKEMRKIIHDLAEQLEEQKQQNKRIEGTVYQLLGGLYNQGSQRDVLMSHINSLYPSLYRGDFDPEKISEENIWPTTRQGDELEAKFIKQRKKYKKLKKRLKILEARV